MMVILRRTSPFLVLMLLLCVSTGCISPFDTHGHVDDVTDVWGQKAREAHRKWDRHFLGLDWDDPYHDWHDESYATGPMHEE